MTMNRRVVRMFVCVLFLSAVVSTSAAEDECGACSCGQGSDRVRSGAFRTALGGVLESLFCDEEPESDSCEVTYCEQCAMGIYSCGSSCEGDTFAIEETGATAPLKISLLPPPAPAPVIEVSYGAWESHEYVKERRPRERPRRNQNRSQGEAIEDEEASTSARSSDIRIEVSPMPVLTEVVLETMGPVETETAESDSVSNGTREGIASAFDPFPSTPLEATEPTVVRLEESESFLNASSDDEETSVFFWDFESTEQVDAPAEPDA